MDESQSESQSSGFLDGWNVAGGCVVLSRLAVSVLRHWEWWTGIGRRTGLHLVGGRASCGAPASHRASCYKTDKTSDYQVS